jgi:hypothetical protein
MNANTTTAEPPVCGMSLTPAHSWGLLFKSCELSCRVTESGGATATCTANLEVHSCKSFFALFQSRHGSRARTTKTQYRKFETNIPRKGIARPQSQFPHSRVCEGFIYSHNRSTCSAVDRSWEYINRSQTHECGYWD